MSSIQSKPGMGEVTIENPVPYAAIHNDGGDIPPTVSPKMRRFVWHMAYSLAGTKGRGGALSKDLSEEARMWKCLALTKMSKKRKNGFPSAMRPETRLLL